MSDSPADSRKLGLEGVSVALVTLVVHGVIAARTPLVGSFQKYSRAVEQWRAGELNPERLMDFSPLYFRIHLWLEPWAERPEVLLEVVQIVLGALCVGLLYTLVARRTARRWAILAAALFAFDRHLLVYSRILEPEIPLLFLLLTTLVLLDHPDRRWAPVSGTTAALAVAARPTFLPVFALVPLYFRLRGGRGRPWAVKSVLFLLPLLVVVGLLGAQAKRATGDPRTPVMNPGTVFFEGNNPHSHGTSAIYPPAVLASLRQSFDEADSAHRIYREVARGSAGSELAVDEVNAYWWRRAVAYLRAEPLRALGLLREKLVRAVHAYRWHDVQAAWVYERTLPLPAVPLALLAPLALLGAAYEARRWRESLPMYVLGGLQLTVMLVFYVSARQRVVLLPAVLYFVAIALARLAEQRRRALPAVGLCLVLSLVLLLPDAQMRDQEYTLDGFSVANRQLSEILELTARAPLAHHDDRVVAMLASAPWRIDDFYPAYFPREGRTLEQRLAEALEERLLDPSLPSAHRDGLELDAARVFFRAGRLDAAEDLLQDLVARGVKVYRGGLQPSHPATVLARVRLRRGDLDGAKELLLGVLDDSPGDAFALAELYALDGRSEHLDRLLAFWSELDARYLVGLALLRQGKAEQAAPHLSFVVERLPQLREARVALAAALAALDRLDQAVEQYLRAVRLRSEPIVEAEAIVGLFRRWSAARPDDPAAQLAAARVLHQHGLFTEALDRLRKVEATPETRAAIAQEIAVLKTTIGGSSF